MTTINWNEVLDSISENAEEPEVEDRFVKRLLNALGFSSDEWVQQFKTGKGLLILLLARITMRINFQLLRLTHT